MEMWKLATHHVGVSGVRHRNHRPTRLVAGAAPETTTTKLRHNYDTIMATAHNPATCEGPGKGGGRRTGVVAEEKKR